MANPAWPPGEPPLLPFAYIHPRVQEAVVDGRPVQLFQQALMEHWVEASRRQEAGGAAPGHHGGVEAGAGPAPQPDPPPAPSGAASSRP
eukprot:10282517-Alexandrium_andersonii.AAC.1